MRKILFTLFAVIACGLAAFGQDMSGDYASFDDVTVNAYPGQQVTLTLSVTLDGSMAGWTGYPDAWHDGSLTAQFGNASGSADTGSVRPNYYMNVNVNLTPVNNDPCYTNGQGCPVSDNIDVECDLAGTLVSGGTSSVGNFFGYAWGKEKFTGGITNCDEHPGFQHCDLSTTMWCTPDTMPPPTGNGVQNIQSINDFYPPQPLGYWLSIAECVRIWAGHPWHCPQFADYAFQTTASSLEACATPDTVATIPIVLFP